MDQSESETGKEVEVLCPHCKAKIKTEIPQGCQVLEVHLHDTLIQPYSPEITTSWKCAEVPKFSCPECGVEIHVEFCRGENTAKHRHILERVIESVADIILYRTRFLRDKIKLLDFLLRVRETRRFLVGALIGFILCMIYPDIVLFLTGNPLPKDIYAISGFIGAASILFIYKVLRDIKITCGTLEENLREEQGKVVDAAFQIIYSWKTSFVSFLLMLVTLFIINSKIAIWSDIYLIAHASFVILGALVFPLIIGYAYFLGMLPQYIKGGILELRDKIRGLADLSLALIFFATIIFVIVPSSLWIYASDITKASIKAGIISGNISVFIALFSLPIFVIVSFAIYTYLIHRITAKTEEDDLKGIMDILRPALGRLNKVNDEKSKRDRLDDISDIKRSLYVQTLLRLEERVSSTRWTFSTKNIIQLLSSIVIALIPLILSFFFK